MPYKSDAQRRYFNANRTRLEAEGVDVDEWNQASKGQPIPKKKSEKSAAGPQLSSCLDSRIEPSPGARMDIISLAKQAASAWRTAANLPKVLARVNPGAVTDLAGKDRLRTGVLNQVKQHIYPGAVPTSVTDMAAAAKSVPKNWFTRADPTHPTAKLLRQNDTLTTTPQVLYRGHSPQTATTPFKGTYSHNWAHGSPHLDIAQGYSVGNLPGMVSIHGAAKRQRYYPDYKMEQIAGARPGYETMAKIPRLANTWNGALQQLSVVKPDTFGGKVKQTMQNLLGFGSQLRDQRRLQLQANPMLTKYKVYETPLRPNRNPLQHTLMMDHRTPDGVIRYGEMDAPGLRKVQSLAQQAAKQVSFPQ